MLEIKYTHLFQRYSCFLFLLGNSPAPLALGLIHLAASLIILITSAAPGALKSWALCSSPCRSDYFQVVNLKLLVWNQIPTCNPI